MGWYFLSKDITNGVAKADAETQTIKIPKGSIRALFLNLEATTNASEAGVRLTTPKSTIFPKMGEDSDEWFMMSTVPIIKQFEEVINLEKVAPVTLTLEGFNTDSAARFAQIGVYVDPWESDIERIIARAAEVLDAISVTITQPDIEKQLRRLWEILQNIMKGGE